ncbi:enoyl-CoA hydratase/isomerase family protein [Paeniglutamicibacter sp. ABSL32-1]|uniref:enoyl-CoA hydratase/isomerase family protein n=1 Tax=Paeniglutamicibacter quisquiliarum TaxID=2849498 RepID=UPI001C2CE182|nr:enoyl-CoA hydratase/isomerase family protein [Paeniglutamicibacter quisquiliarum]MBV1778121.1 enoyl-CoA hydratase/isomerase family protein [Paeniglutamicibacter quisquiliarum]
MNRTRTITTLIDSTVLGTLGLVALRRPEQINALTGAMLQELTDVLTTWRDDARVSMVVLRGEGARGFCAGGDIKDFHHAVTNGGHARFLELLALEFRLDEMIANYPKPVVTLVHGLCMGGGIGLASHAAIRIATPDAQYAMPEARIGYSPDVGATHLMARAPGHLGEYLVLTADTFTGADAVELGFADMLVDAERFEEVIEALPDFESMPAADIAAGLEVLFGSFDASPLASAQPWIDAAFGAPTLAEILERLDAMVHPAARAAAARMRANSPTSLECALLAVRAARAEDHLPSALARELRVADYLMHRDDLAEGIRAQVIDKDRSPAWNPAELGQVDREKIAAVIADSE